MLEDYIKNPKNIRDLAQQLKLICDNYWTGKESEQVLREYILHVANHNKLLEQNGKEINRSIKTIIGKRRIDLITTMLENYQYKFF